MIDLGAINIRLDDKNRIVLAIQTYRDSKFDQLEGTGFSLKEALEDLTIQIEDISN